MTYLARRIGDKLEEDNKELRGLGNLTAINLKKAHGRAQIPEGGKAMEHLKDGDHVLCDVQSPEMWIKTTINFSYMIGYTNRRSESHLELKLDRTMPIDEYKKLMQKLSIKIWNKQCLEDNIMKNKFFIMKELRI